MAQRCHRHNDYDSYMASDHPADAVDRSQRACDWPINRAAPGRLEIIRRFCNTANRESGSDLLLAATAFDAWLIEQQRTPVDADPAELDRVVRFRELLRGHAIAHRLWARGHDLGDIARAIQQVPLVMAQRNGRLVIEPGTATGTDRFLAGLGLDVIEADRADKWPRLKACQGCSWVFYDNSKNASGRWCSMSACGGRAKVRNYRRRQPAT
jgi:predicted RNA-binding Zn ribbon-like protein